MGKGTEDLVVVCTRQRLAPEWRPRQTAGTYDILQRHRYTNSISRLLGPRTSYCIEPTVGADLKHENLI